MKLSKTQAQVLKKMELGRKYIYEKCLNEAFLPEIGGKEVRNSTMKALLRMGLVNCTNSKHNNQFGFDPSYACVYVLNANGEKKQKELKN